MSAYIRLMRPSICFASIIAVWIGSLLAGAALIPGKEILYGFVAVFLICGAGMAVNDIFDVNVDKHNKPKRPLPSGKASIGKAKAFAAALFIIGNFFGWLVGRNEFFITLIASVLLVAYAWKLKKVPVASHFVASFLLALVFFFGGFIAGDIAATAWIGIIMFVSNMGREVFKTIDDMLGDKKANIDSIALRLGVIKTKTVASVFILIAVLLSFAPFLIGSMNEIYLFFVILADIAFVSAIGAPVRYSSKFAKIGLAIVVLAFFLGTGQVQTFLG